MPKPWAKYEVGFINHDKFRAMSANAICLWLEGKNYADDKLTDGVLPNYEVKHWRFYSKKNVDALTASVGNKPGTETPWAPLWEPHPDGWKMHDYLVHNDCRELALARKARAEAERAADRARKKAMRDAKHAGSPAGSPGRIRAES